MPSLKNICVVTVIFVTAIIGYKIVGNNPRTPPEPSVAQLSSELNSAAQIDGEDVSNPVLIEQKAQPNITNELADSSASSTDQPNTNYPSLPAYEIGNGPISDEDLNALVDRLNNDPALMEDLINELRSESDPERLNRLIFILGATENAAVIPTAREMIYSGIDSSRKAGLDLLRRVASKNPEAYTLASDLLISETEPTVLISALTVLAHPDAASPEVLDGLTAQVLTLTEHDSAAVRGYSVSMLAKLSNSADVSPVLHNALYDSSPSVRSSATYALANFPHQSDETNQKLLELAGNESEPFDVRRGAYLALSNNSADEALKARLEEIELSMRKKVRPRR